MLPNDPLLTALKIAIIFFTALLLRILISFFSKKIIAEISTGTPTQKRIRTMSSLLVTTASLIIWSVTFLMVIKEIGFDITPLLTGVGLFGLAISFGAQTLVKDIISGFIILMEDQLSEGDEVEIQGKKGVVEKVNLRTIVLKDKAGVLHYIPNGSINLVSNFSKKGLS